MAANQQPNWRDTGNEPSESKGSTGNRPWQPSDGPASDSLAPSKRGIKRTIALFALIGVAIIAGAVIIMLIPPSPSCLVVAGSGYETNLLMPSNAHGWNGLVRLEKEVAESGGLGKRWSWDKPTKLRQVGERPVEIDESTWTETWDKLNVASYKEKTVVVYLSMHGMADEVDAYLLPNLPSKQALKAFDGSRIRFREVLDTLIAVKGKNVVLMLDVCHAQSYWPLGMMHNDFVKRLQEKYEHEINETKHLTVICSTSPNQRSWASDELQNTAFGHYVSLGLRGGGHKSKDDVTALSLFEYVKAKVDNWAQTNRARNQTPLLLGGADRARAMTLVHVEQPAEEAVPETVAFPVAKLQSAWNLWRELRTEHAPHVHSPHLWRLYQETLLRYEQLLRTGDPSAKASELQKNLATLHSEIAVSRSLERAYKSLSSSFPMHQVLGFPVTEPIADEELQAFLLDLDKVNFADAGSKAKELGKVFDRFANRTVLEKQYIQTRLGQLIMQQMDRSGKTDRLRKQVLLAEIEDRLRTAHHAAELHLVKMLRDADPKQDEKTIQLALRVRMLAEEAALSARAEGNAGELYSETIFRWIRDDMEKADQIRRDGEDHLFGDPKTHGERATKKLQEAEKAYKEIRARAQNLQTAMALRDEVSAELPTIARWLALPHPHLNKEAVLALRMSAELLGNRLSVLNRDLDDTTRKAPPHPDTLTQIGDEIRTMREKYREACEALKIGVALQQNWHGIDAALAIPPLDTRDVALRIALLTKQRDISGQLIANKAPQGQPEDEDAPSVRVDRERKLFQASIKSLYELRAADKENVDDGARGFFFKLPSEILAKSELVVERKELVAAANMCRLIPGAFVDFVKDDAKKRINPVDQLRRTNMGRLLHWQAKRELEDHWFDPGKETPYYETAAKSYLSSASNLFDEGQMPDSLRNEGTALNKRLALAKLNVPKLGKLYWTTESEFTFAFRVEADADLPTGTPMVWLDAPGGNKSGWPRKSIDPWKNPTDKYLLDNTNFKDEGEMQVQLHAYYRGQHIVESTTTVRAKPNVIARHTPARKETTALAVRMDSTFDYGAISIILDTSYSMRYLHPNPNGLKEKSGDPKEGTLKENNRRFDFALHALEYMLRKVPIKTQLSISTFGDNKPSPIAPFRRMSPWLKEDLDNLPSLRKRLDAMPLDDTTTGSPIADAIVTTMENGFPGISAKSQRLILILTDGADTGSQVRDGNDRDDRIAALLKDANRKKGNEDIVVVVVCFIDRDLETAEFKKAERQFDVVKNFGKFLDVSEGPKLGRSIDGMIRPRVKLYSKTGLKVPGFNDGVPINYRIGDDALAWKSVDPGDYKATVIQSTPNPLVDLEMLTGQKMFMVFRRKDSSLALRRGLLSYQPEAEQRQIRPEERKGWLVSMFENENRGFKAEQLLIIEKSEVEEETIRQPLPGFVWLEMDAIKGAKPDKTLHWWRDWNAPGAAYRLEMEGWAPNRFPKASAWFTSEEKDDFLRNRTLLRPAKRPVPFQEVPQAPLDNHSVIESVEWREAKVLDEKRNEVKKDCLIVRVRHAPGRPVWVDLAARGPNVGSEHQYFTGASSTTAFFYGLSRTDLVGLTLMDIVDFKAAAQAVEIAPDNRIELPKLLAPE